MVLSVFLTIVTYRNFYASKVFLRDVVSCQFTDLSFLLAVLFIFVRLCVALLLINSFTYLLTSVNLAPVLQKLSTFSSSLLA